MPALASLSKREQRRRMRKIVKGGSSEEWYALVAHCSSFKKLQYVESLEKELVEEKK